MPTLPLRLRNRLAETILAALHDAHARHELAALASDPVTHAGLEGDDARWADPFAARARAALAAVAGQPLQTRDADLRRALRAAACLFDAGLYFEVHELLEPHWMAAGGEERQALQGLIQVAVAWQHLANGNTAGARSLLIEGGARLHGGRLLGIDLESFARAAGEAAERVAAGLPPVPARFPTEPGR
jgi:hypothetical protein